MEYKIDLKNSVEKRFTTCLSNMIQNIKENHLTILQCFVPQKKDVYQEVKEMEPFMVDWSNIPDYLRSGPYSSLEILG